MVMAVSLSTYAHIMNSWIEVFVDNLFAFSADINLRCVIQPFFYFIIPWQSIFRYTTDICVHSVFHLFYTIYLLIDSRGIQNHTYNKRKGKIIIFVHFAGDRTAFVILEIVWGNSSISIIITKLFTSRKFSIDVNWAWILLTIS